MPLVDRSQGFGDHLPRSDPGLSVPERDRVAGTLLLEKPRDCSDPGIDHRVPDQVDAGHVDPLTAEILDGTLAVDEEAAEVVGQASVRLLRIESSKLRNPASM